MQDYKIGIIGTEEAVAGFMALGVTCFPITQDDEIKEIINQIKNDAFAAIFITEDWAIRVRNQIDEAFRDAALPAVVTVPSPGGATKAGLENLKKIVEQAVGSDILFNK
jgi:V/A-type H+/Na+-transporting ATPase subunit F